MTADWKQWEGRVVKGDFPLQRFLGGSERSAVFLVEKSTGGQAQTAIRFIDATSDDARGQLQRWEAASKLSHPNLIRIFETGRCEVAGNDFLYALTEYAEEDLSQILPARALTAVETRQMLEAVLSALTFIHGDGLVHGSLKPSNILAVGDAVKISSDTLRHSGAPLVGRAGKSAYDAPEAGEGTPAPPADVWALGVTLVEALTQRLPVLDPQHRERLVLPEGIPQPFREIVENSLQVDPAKRWTVSEIAARLRRGEAEPAPRAVALPDTGREAASAPSSIAEDGKQSAKWPYALALAAVVVVAAVLIARPKPQGSSPEVQATPAQSKSPTATPNPAAREQPGGGLKKASSATTPPGRRETGLEQGDHDQMLITDTRRDVLRRVAPQVSPGARRTITGMIRVLVSVDVDAAGNVTEARLQSAGPSKYFARLALEAARGWKFKPAVANGRAVESQWTLRFGFSRRSTEGSAERTAP